MTRQHPPRANEELAEFAEAKASLWQITLGPLAWAAHFAICTGVIALSCAKGWAVAGLRDGLVWLSLGVLALILWIGWRAARQWRPRSPNDGRHRPGRAEDRHQFLGHAAFLLAIISFVGVVFVTLPLLLVEGCR